MNIIWSAQARGDLREVHEGGYRIIYGVQDEQFQVVTIIHMRQQLTRGRLR